MINEKINANNNIFTFFDRFYEVFISTTSSGDEKENFIKDINALFFNQILSLIILWELCRIKYASSNQKPLMPITYCLDNLDVLVNKEIIEKFFKEYFRFVRNIDSIIQQIDDDFIKSNRIYYNTIFSFIFSCRQHTWARVRQHYRHDNSFVSGVRNIITTFSTIRIVLDENSIQNKILLQTDIIICTVNNGTRGK